MEHVTVTYYNVLVTGCWIVLHLRENLRKGEMGKLLLFDMAKVSAILIDQALMVGLNASRDPVNRSLYESRTRNGAFDVGFCIANPQRHTGEIDNDPRTPLYGHWYSNSTNPSEEPPKDHPIRQIWTLWDQTKVEADETRRNSLFTRTLDIHNQYPYPVGTVGQASQPVIVSNNQINVPDGYLYDDRLRCANLVQYSFKPV